MFRGKVTRINMPRVSAVFAKEPALVLTALIFVLLVPLIGWLVIADPRTVDGVNIWVKPLKFAASLSLYAATLALFAQ
jgi:hypothetical protein